MPKTKKLSEELLIEEYCRKNKKMEEIAKENNCSIAHVSRQIKNFKLKPPIEEKYIDIRFGNLIPKKKVGKDKNSHMLLECICDCGKTFIVLANALITGNTSSCGCTSRKRGMHHKNYKGYQEIRGCLWKSLEVGAKLRNIEFSITIEQGWDLYIKQNGKCALSGIDIKFSETNIAAKYQTASLDRIDSTKGYTIDNIQWVHKSINFMKQHLPDEIFIYWCTLVSDHSRNKNINNSKIEKILIDQFKGQDKPNMKSFMKSKMTIEQAYNLGLKKRNICIEDDTVPLWMFGRSTETVNSYLRGLFLSFEPKYYGCYANKISFVESLSKLMNKNNIKTKINIHKKEKYNYSIEEE